MGRPPRALSGLSRTMKATDKLRVYYSKREQDMGGWHPLGKQTQCDLAYLMYALTPIITELDSRGYDTRTLRLSVEPKAGDERFASQREPK